MNMDDLNLENAAEPAAPETEASPAEEQITLDESGELNIPDSFFEGFDKGEETKAAAPEAEPEAKTEPAYYTPEEFAAAFAGGTIDEAKLRPEVAAFYKAAVGQMPEQSAPPVQAAAPVQSAPAPRAMTPQHYATLREAAKRVAAQSYLGIDPADFDEMDPTHADAARFAMGQIQARAQEIAMTRAAEAARAQRLTGEIQSLDAEYRQKDPEFFRNHAALMRDYLGRMPFRAAAEAIGAIQAGDAAGIRKFISGVYADYKAASANKGDRRAAVPPPPVMKAGGTEEGQHAGMADVSGLGEMSPEEQAAWLVKNKFAV